MIILQKLTTIFILFFSFSYSVFGAEVFFSSQENFFPVEQSVPLTLQVNTEGITLNTFSGSIVFPEIFSVDSIQTSNSTIVFWLEQPYFNKDTRVLSFSGITPGGISGTNLELFSLLLTSKSESFLEIIESNFEFLIHDGLGTLAPVTFSNQQVIVFSDTIQSFNVDILEDTQPPEDFVPIITRDENLFDNLFVLIFSTQDKLSGISHYEVREGRFGSFVRAESPYVLRNQKLSRVIYVRAFDNQGNVRTVRLDAVNRFEIPYGIINVFIVAVLLLIILRKIFLKNRL